MNDLARDTRSVVLNAKDEPILGRKHVGTHERYRFPQLTLEDRKLSVLPPDYIRLRMRYVGICGTDVHLVTSDKTSGYVQSSAPAFIPPSGRVIGHEGVGEIVAMGSQVSHLRIGMMVAPESIVSCGLCARCRRGMFNQCDHAKLIGMEADGLFSEFSDIPARLAQPIGPLGESDEGLRAAALLEPAGVAYLACENARVSPGDSVLIIGAGPIGLLCAILAKKIFGASHVSMSEQSEFRRSFAQTWCDTIFEPERIHGESGRYDVIIEASGALSDALNLVRSINPNGRLCLLARSGKPLHTDAVDHIISNNISIMGCRGHLGGIFERLINLIISGHLPIHDIVTGILPDLEAVRDVLAKPDQITASHCKLLCKIG